LSGIFVTDGKKQKKNKKKQKTEKNICKTYTHPPHRRLRKIVQNYDYNQRYGMELT